MTIVRDIYLIHHLWFQLILIKDLSILLEKFYEVEVLSLWNIQLMIS